MTLVALEASTRAGSVAVEHDGETTSATLDGERAHASDLLVTLDRLLTDLGAAPARVEAVLVGTGPGSFTGLRVAISIAMGVARGASAAARSVSSIEAALFTALAPDEEGCVVLDARAGELYFAHFRRVEDDVEAVLEPRVVPVGTALELPVGTRLFGDERGIELANLAGATHFAPNASDVLRLGALRLERLGPEIASEIEPLYLRPFAAKKRRR